MQIPQAESIGSQIAHYISAGTGLMVVGYIFTQHRIWVRMKDWINDMREDYCERKGIPFRPLDNGKH